MPLTLAHLDHAPDGRETAPPLLIAHGLFGSARNFQTLGRRLAAGRRVVMVDMRNHGASPWDDDVSYPAMAEDLGETVRRLCGGRAAVLGHSMGGKAAMALALAEPGLVERLVVADIAPVAYEHSHEGYIAAMQGVDLDRVGRRSDAEPALAEAVPQKALRAFLLQNLVIEEGRANWRINLSALDAGMGVLTGFPDIFAHSAYEGPTLFLHGGASDYVSPQHHDRIRALFPRTRIEALEGAGHWLHAEQPDAFVEAVSRFLDEN